MKTKPPEKVNQLPTMYTINDVATYLQCTPRYVRQLLAERKLGSVHIGSHVRIAQEDLAKFLAQHKKEAIERSRIRQEWR